MIFLELFLGFLKVGCFSFGGAYAAIPLIRDVVMSYGWLSEEMLSYMIAVSESTPGPIMINLATYVGTSQAGILGAALATFAVVLPSFVIILLVSVLLKKAIQNPWFQAALRGLKPSMIGIVLATGIWISIKNCMAEAGMAAGRSAGSLLGRLDPAGVIFTLCLGGIYFALKYVPAAKKIKKYVSPISLICTAAIAGIIVFGMI